MVIPCPSSIGMFVGAGMAKVLEMTKPKFADNYVISISSGLIAGECLIGVLVAILTALAIIK